MFSNSITIKSKLCLLLLKEINTSTKMLNTAISYVNHKYF